MRLSVTSKIAAATGAGVACVAIGVALAGSSHHPGQTIVIRQDAATGSASVSTSAAAPKTATSTTAAAVKQTAAVVQVPVQQQAQPAAAPDSTTPAPPASSDVNTLPVATGSTDAGGVLRPPPPPLSIPVSTSPGAPNGH